MQPFGAVLRYDMVMAITPLKFAVYYGTIRLTNGTPATFTAAEVAALYNVGDQPYLAVPLVGTDPFQNGQDYMQYVHLKPLPSAQYYDAKERYNFNNEVQMGDDFVVGQGKWAKRPSDEFDEDIS